jgi:predicted flap endonuclease-1-like 5' DNA nuclease
VIDPPDVRPVGDLPDVIGRTAAHVLALNGLTTLAAVARTTRRELLALHGVGPKAVRILAEELARHGRSFRDG